MRFLRALLVMLAIAAPAQAFAQATVLQGGPTTPGHVPQYVGAGTSQPVIQDGGGAGGGSPGVNPSEQGLTVRNPAGVYPADGVGNGPAGTNWCDYDAPITNATGYHYICLGFTSSGGTIAFGNGGGAAPLPFTVNINGVNTTLGAGGLNGQVQYNNNGALGGLTNAQLTALIIAAGSNGQVQVNSGGQLGAVTNTQLTALINIFSPSLSGAVPASGGGTINFLRSDGQWVAPGLVQTGYQQTLLMAHVSGSAAGTTGTISASTSALALASATDFQTGQGIRVNHAGAASEPSTPTLLTVTPQGTGGSTTYNYQIVAFDANGGYSAATAAGTTTTGNATLSATNYNSINWTASSGAVGYAIYGGMGATRALLAFVNGVQFYDFGAAGFASSAPPDWLPSAPPVTAASDWLVTTIASGGGTTSLTLGATATTLATGQTVFHDDTVALQAGISAAAGVNAPISLNPAATYRISSPLAVSTGALTLYGAGIQSGSTIALTSPTQDGLQITTTVASHVSYMNFVANYGSTLFNVGGSYIRSSNHDIDILDHLEMQYCFDCITTASPAFHFESNYLQGTDILMSITSPGDATINNNDIDPVQTPGGVVGVGVEATGDASGLRIVNNKFNAGNPGYGIAVAINDTVSDGDLLINSNSMEGWTIAGVSVNRTGSVSFGNIAITGNEIASSAALARDIYFPNTTGGWLSGVTITGNILDAGLEGVDAEAVAGIVIAANVISGATGVGIRIGTATTSCMIGANTFISTPTQIQDGSGACSFTSISGSAPTYP
jgi:hypothetical protein